jgi:hypothetical protein
MTVGLADGDALQPDEGRARADLVRLLRWAGWALMAVASDVERGSGGLDGLGVVARRLLPVVAPWITNRTDGEGIHDGSH